MSVFRRRGRREDEPGIDVPDASGAPDEYDEYDEYDGAGAAAEPPVPRPPGRESGPWDVSEVDDPGTSGRMDLGGVWVPGAPGLEVRVEADNTTGTVIAVTLVLGDGALQLQPFAAPRSEGIWPEVRAEIRAGITQQGGTADEVEGPVGMELRTKVSVRAQDGRTGVEPARFLGVDGPRWFLRGVLTGRPAVEPATDRDLIALFRDVVVVRGVEPMAPREPIPLTLPSDPAEGEDAGHAAREALNPFARGPEITEIR